MAYVILLVGVACAAAGGELFLRGAVGLAHWARISAGIIGVTVAAFATSSPELSVAIGSALSGTPSISLGDALGSNVLNIALILGLVLTLGSLQANPADLKRDYPVALLAPVLLGLLAADGIVSRIDGIVLLAAFTMWMVFVTHAVHRQRSAAGEVLGEQRHTRAVLALIGGLALLIAAGRLIVTGATDIAVQWGLDAFVIGSVIVAVGTSVPEMATSLMARLRGHDDVSLSTLLGSNIFNGLFIIGVAAVIYPITVRWSEVAMALLFGLVVVGIVWPTRRHLLPRWRGLVLLGVYALYVIATVRMGH
jgi:cation:H+ antiporter